jgi:undecaprenyl pyrophosphate phosphatase UppP
MNKKLFHPMIARWGDRWKKESMTDRLKELAYQFIWYVIWTIVLIGIFGGIAYTFLPKDISEPGIIFLAILYLLLLMITTVRLFENNRIKFLMNKIEDIEDTLHEFMMKEGCE